MANDVLTMDIDAAAVVRLLGRVTPAVQAAVNRAAKETAERIQREADRRAAAFFPGASGLTREGITTREAEGGNGWVVVAERDPLRNLPLWLDKGTKHMVARGPAQEGFFDAAGKLEEGPHRRRLVRELSDAVEGLGQ